jgi:hypothetical protein
MTEVTEAEAEKIHEYEVSFLDLNTNESARFAVEGDSTLQQAWDEAYTKLGEARRESDVLESRSGEILTAHLGQTIRYVREHVVRDLRFQIHGEQGGA